MVREERAVAENNGEGAASEVKTRLHFLVDLDARTKPHDSPYPRGQPFSQPLLTRVKTQLQAQEGFGGGLRFPSESSPIGLEERDEFMTALKDVGGFSLNIQRRIIYDPHPRSIQSPGGFLRFDAQTYEQEADFLNTLLHSLHLPDRTRAHSSI